MTETPTVDLEITSTPLATETTVIEPTFDPCAEQPIDESGEVVDPCVTPSATATIDPCQPDETETQGVDPCVTPSPSLTPTLEYEIDVPVSFFPSGTAAAEGEETVAGVQSTADAVGSGDEVTGLPNTGSVGSDSGSSAWLIATALLAVTGSLTLLMRSSSRLRR